MDQVRTYAHANATTGPVRNRAPAIERGSPAAGAGNLAVQALLRGGFVRTKLAVNEPGDTYEQEADRVADQVMRMPKPELSIAPAPVRVSRRCAACEAEEEDAQKLQRKIAGTRNAADREAPPIVHEVLRTPGQPLDAATRAFFEPRFGHDFSQVRVHTDDKAAQSARKISALAYTVGQDIAFADGQYAERRLVAHELAHTIQQGQQTGALSRRPVAVLQRQDDQQDQEDQQDQQDQENQEDGGLPPGGATTDQTQVTPANGDAPGDPDPCKDLIERIIGLLDEVARRINDALNDPHNLYRDFRTTPHPEYGSWEGHRQRFYSDRQDLRDKIAEWESDDMCRGYPLSEQQQEDLNEAYEFKEKEYPDKPANSMNEGQELGWDTVLTVVIALGLSVALVPTIVAALLDPEPASKLALAGLTLEEIQALLAALATLGFKTA